MLARRSHRVVPFLAAIAAAGNALALQPAPPPRTAGALSLAPTPEPDDGFGLPSTRLAAFGGASLSLSLAQPETSDAVAGGDGSADLAKKLQNPVANLISVPLQSNWDTGFADGDGGEDGWRYTLNIQPVIPISISDEWNLITRTILPIIYQDDVGATGDEFGLGDVLATQFFSPKDPGPWGIIWGVGPAWLLPTATDEALGAKKWGVGPSAVALRQSGPWTYGLLANHIWSFAEADGADGRRDVNATFLQPFASYTFPDSTSIGLNTESSYDWLSHDWVVPVNLTVGRLFRLGSQPVNFTVGGRYYAEPADGGPEWGVRFVVTLLFPK